MSDNNYNEETETVQNIFDYVNNNSQDQRQSHIDLNSECIPYYLTRNTWNGNKIGNLASKPQSMRKAKENMLKFLNISDFRGREIHTCHKCQNNSGSSNFICVNPLHIYFGTQSENEIDKDPEIRKKNAIKAGKIGGKIGGSKSFKSQIANGKHINQIINTCPYCNKSAKGPSMKRWHFDNCKQNTQNISKVL